MPPTPSRIGTSARTSLRRAGPARAAGSSPSQPRTGLQQRPPRRPAARVEPGGEGVAAGQLRGGLAPPVRLAPLEQRMHGRAASGPLLALRRRSRDPRPAALGPAAIRSRRRGRRSRAPAPCRSGRRSPRRRRSRCRRGAGWGPPAGCARPAAAGPRRAARSGAARACGRGQLGRSLGRGEVDADRDLGGLEARVEPRARLRRGTATVESASRSIPKPLDDSLDHRGAGFVSRPGSGLTTPLRISRSRARVAATWKRRRPSSASRSLASSQSSA